MRRGSKFDFREELFIVIGIRGQDDLPYGNEFQQHGNPVGMVFVQVGQHQGVHTGTSGALQPGSGCFTGIVQGVLSAAVKHQRRVPRKDTDTGTLPDVHRGDYGVSAAVPLPRRHQRRCQAQDAQ